MRVLIIGAGGHAKVIADAILSHNRLKQDYRVIGYLDDDKDLVGKEQVSAQVLGPLSLLDRIDFDVVVVGIGENHLRSQIYARLKQEGRRFATIIHPKAAVASDSVIGPGTVVFAGAVVNSSALIGENVIINTCASADHDNVLGDHVHLGPGARLGGTVTVGEGAFLGIGSSVLPNRHVGRWSVVGSGAVVHRDVDPESTVVGVPARLLRK